MTDTSNINERGHGHGSLDQDRSGTPLLAQGERAKRRQVLKDVALDETQSFETRAAHKVALGLFN